MVELYLIRHGVAVDRGTPGVPDAKRPLTEEGVQRVRGVARGLQRLGIRPQRIYTSPWLRAVQTAEWLSAELEVEPPKPVDAMVPAAPKSRLMTVLSEESALSIALVGHESHLSQLLSYLITGSEDAAIDIRKGGVACLTCEGKASAGAATLRWLLTSKHLRLLAAA